MARSSSLFLVLAGVLGSMGASYRVQSTNFLVDAPTPQIAQQVAQYAEHYRKEKAVQWLGREMPPWREPCPLRVVVSMQGAGGATTFEFGNAEVVRQHMQIEGSLDRLLSSVLPHEITHTLFAHYFRCPLPRWADEGGAVLSEDDMERNRHDQMVRQILNTPGRAMPLRRLFTLREYPHDVMTLYAQGFSVTNFLVDTSGRPNFLNFVIYGMRHGWDAAVQTHYRYRTIEELERAWVDSLRTPRQAPMQLALNTTPAQIDTASRVVVRQTAPAVQASLEMPRPIYRGQAPAEGERDGEGPRSQPAMVQGAVGAPGYSVPSPAPGLPASQPGPVLLGAPQYVSPPPPQLQLGMPIPTGPSPVGYPN